MHINVPLSEHESESLFRSLKVMSTVRHIAVLRRPQYQGRNIDRALEDSARCQFFGHLAKLNHVQRLGLSGPLTRGMVEEAERTTTQPFEQLLELCCTASLDEITTLWCHLRALEFLKLEMLGERAAIASISGCHNLRVLDVFSSHQFQLSAEELITMARGCSQLQRLEIGFDWANINATDLTDVHMETLASSLTKLKVLSLMADSQLSFKSLISLGLHCPGLEKCELGGAFDLSSLKFIDRVLFPELRYLELDGVEVAPLSRYVATFLGNALLAYLSICPGQVSRECGAI